MTDAGRPTRQFAGRLLELLGVAAMFGALAYLSVTLTRDQSRIAAVWLPNAVLVAILLQRHRPDPLMMLAAFAANVVANMAAGDALDRAAALSLVNSIEVALVCFGMRRAGNGRPNMESTRDLIAFCAIGGLIAPAIAAAIATAILSPTGRFEADLWVTWWLTDSLGLLIFAPAIWIGIDTWTDRIRAPHVAIGEWILVLGATIVATLVIFSQTSYPLLFVVTPFVLLAAFRLGALGSAAAIILIAVIASIATQQNVGPMALVRGDMTDRLHVLQGFLAVSFFMSLPVAVTLARRETMAAELRASEALNRSMLDNMREVIFRTDAQGRWVFLNPAWRQMTGYSVDESLGWMTTRLLHPDDLVEARKTYPKLISGAIDECTLRQRFYRKDGECAFIEVSVRALRDDAGAFIGTTGNIRDITERTLAQQALEERDAQLLLLAENATDAVFRLTLAGHCIYASPSAERLLGLNPRHLVGAHMLDRFHPDDRQAAEAAFRQLASGERDTAIVAYRSELVRSPGTYRWLEAHLGLVRDPATRSPKEVIASIRDISATKALEEELRIASATAEHAAQAKAAFLANMSHEIRTPMNGVIGFTDLLRASELTDEQRRYVELIAASGRAMMRLLNDILDVSKIEAGEMQVVEEPINFAHLLRGSIRLMEPVSRAKSLDLDLVIDTSVPAAIKSDPLRLRQVLLNLIGNAIKFTIEGGVTVHAGVDEGGDLRIEVSDTGIGIDPAKLSTIFDKFAQADPSIARRFGGTGLGLSISSQLVKLMGGRIEVRPNAGRGTTFSVILPLRPAELPVAERKVDAEHAAAEPSAGGRVRVLIAEDHDINQELMLAMMKGLGVDATIAADGGQAITEVERAEAAGQPYDLVLMDMQMPHVDGLEATRRLRAAAYPADRLPIVALTANAYADEVAACLGAGMQHHLAKPVSAAELSDVLDRFVPRRRAKPNVPPAAAAQAQLHDRYLDRKRLLLTQAETLADAAQWSDAEHQMLVAELHKFAGIAGMFGDQALGQSAGELEQDLENASPEQRTVMVREWLGRVASPGR